jgi:hypothetical protein
MMGRYIISIVVGLAVTVSLLFVMQLLIVVSVTNSNLFA